MPDHHQAATTRRGDLAVASLQIQRIIMFGSLFGCEGSGAAVGKKPHTAHIQRQCRRGLIVCGLRPRHSYSVSMSTLSDEILRRRTFAIISHPDAGKTTLTEKLLLFGGAIQLAGEVKPRGERRRVRSDWMAVERGRGRSVSSAVMRFEHGARLQPPRHTGPPGFQ